MKQAIKKKHFTIIELMFVIVIISLIAGVVAYNMQGVLDRGRAFKTRTAIEKLEAILNLQVASNPELLEDIELNWEGLVSQDPLAGNPKAITYDGWGKKFKIEKKDDQINISSEAYIKYKESHPGEL